MGKRKRAGKRTPEKSEFEEVNAFSEKKQCVDVVLTYSKLHFFTVPRITTVEQIRQQELSQKKLLIEHKHKYTCLFTRKCTCMQQESKVDGKLTFTDWSWANNVKYSHTSTFVCKKISVFVFMFNAKFVWDSYCWRICSTVVIRGRVNRWSVEYVSTTSTHCFFLKMH